MHPRKCWLYLYANVYKIVNDWRKLKDGIV